MKASSPSEASPSSLPSIYGLKRVETEISSPPRTSPSSLPSICGLDRVKILECQFWPFKKHTSPEAATSPGNSRSSATYVSQQPPVKLQITDRKFPDMRRSEDPAVPSSITNKAKEISSFMEIIIYLLQWQVMPTELFWPPLAKHSVRNRAISDLGPQSRFHPHIFVAFSTASLFSRLHQISIMAPKNKLASSKPLKRQRDDSADSDGGKATKMRKTAASASSKGRKGKTPNWKKLKLSKKHAESDGDDQPSDSETSQGSAEEDDALEGSAHPSQRDESVPSSEDLGASSEDVPDFESELDFASVEFNEDWTVEDEKELRGNWTSKNDFYIDSMSSAEPALWRKAMHMFSMAPPDLIPSGYEVCNVNKSTLSFQGREIPNPNWSTKFCTTFSRVICCQVFEDRPDFLAHALRWAHYLRLGDDDEKGRPSDEVPSSRCGGFLESFIQNAKATGFRIHKNGLFSKQLKETIQLTLNEKFGSDQPRHVGFIACLEKSVKGRNAPRGKQKGRVSGLNSADMEAICDAWDHYVQLPQNKQFLLRSTQETFKANENPRGRTKGGTQGHIEAVKEMKKNYILAENRTRWINEKRSGPSEKSQEEQFSQEPLESQSQEVGAQSPDLGYEGSQPQRLGHGSAAGRGKGGKEPSKQRGIRSSRSISGDDVRSKSPEVADSPDQSTHQSRDLDGGSWMRSRLSSMVDVEIGTLSEPVEDAHLTRRALDNQISPIPSLTRRSSLAAKEIPATALFNLAKSVVSQSALHGAGNSVPLPAFAQPDDTINPHLEPQAGISMAQGKWEIDWPAVVHPEVEQISDQTLNGFDFERFPMTSGQLHIQPNPEEDDVITRDDCRDGQSHLDNYTYIEARRKRTLPGALCEGHFPSLEFSLSPLTLMLITDYLLVAHCKFASMTYSTALSGMQAFVLSMGMMNAQEFRTLWHNVLGRVQVTHAHLSPPMRQYVAEQELWNSFFSRVPTGGPIPNGLRTAYGDGADAADAADPVPADNLPPYAAIAGNTPPAPTSGPAVPPRPKTPSPIAVAARLTNRLTSGAGASRLLGSFDATWQAERAAYRREMQQRCEAERAAATRTGKGPACVERERRAHSSVRGQPRRPGYAIPRPPRDWNQVGDQDFSQVVRMADEAIRRGESSPQTPLGLERQARTTLDRSRLNELRLIQDREIARRRYSWFAVDEATRPSPPSPASTRRILTPSIGDWYEMDEKDREDNSEPDPDSDDD
ncbi:hypothetical protein G7Y89_g1718 [Cudoniella acicularis]|uniref:Uncharacterized protein n=1 Tax=Cudoniella acicularis TaxID=354080 RepID=A0A8H4RVU5_9HELO|nr:hypothetical protein G7Y89_g1718 [Cudoniella acicularis]